jgi:osmotically-inducible protein OsmY
MRNVRPLLFVSSVLMMCIAAACSRETMDRDIKADITVKAKTELAFAGVGFTVDKGVVTLTGSCPAEPAKQKIETTVRKIAGVKDVVNSIVINPVVIDTDPALKQSVDSALMQFNLATSQVSNNNVVLMGKVKKQDDVQKILKAMQKLKVGTVDNRLVVE